MKAALENMPGNARLWVYQSTKFLSNEEVEIIQSEGDKFVDAWDYHGAYLQASFDVLHNRFVVIAVDENHAPTGGCSIDKSVGLIKGLGDKLGTDFFDRFHVVYKVGDELQSCNYNDLEDLVNAGTVNESTIVYNNSVSSKADFDANWELPLNQSWQGRVLA